jgi:hypothetical protein
VLIEVVVVVVIDMLQGEGFGHDSEGQLSDAVFVVVIAEQGGRFVHEIGWQEETDTLVIVEA